MTFRAPARQSGDVTILDISGRIVLGDGSKELSRQIEELLSAGNKNLLLNLAGVVYIDSTGLGEMVSSYAKIMKAGGRLKLLNSQPRITELLQITKLYTVFESFAEESQAVSSFQEERKGASA